MTVWVAMAAYNEGPRLPPLLARWEAVSVSPARSLRYVVVDDGSTDATAEVLTAFAVDHPLHVITHSPNEGLGSSLRDVLRFVADHGGDDDVVVTMDADNTQPPELLPVMLERMEATGCDVVIASRYRAGARVVGLGPLRRAMSLGARVAFQLAFPIAGVRDYTCGFRLYRVAIIKRAFEVYRAQFCDRPGFECTADILLRLAKLGATFQEVPMTLDYAAKRSSSNMRIGRTIRKTLSLMLHRRFERSLFRSSNQT